MTDASPHPNVTTYGYISFHPLLGNFLTSFCYYFTYFLQSLEEYLVNTVEHLILAVLGYLALCLLMFIFMGMLGFTREMRNAKRVLFVTAHPDDEVMFFGPSIMHYVQKPNCTVYLMCLSSGKNYGMDKVRTNELYESCKILGIKEENIFVHNNTDLPDAMDVRWPLEIIAKHVIHTVEAFNITNIVTFDRYGISGHQNHCSIYYAIANLILDEELPKTCGVFVLETVNIVRKYGLILDIPISFIMSRFRVLGGFRQRSRLFEAMYKHKSQLVWFRRLYLWSSRYMLINTLTQVNLVDIELDYLEMED
ncbi:N-acetylglucosaminyl-phosphatidylinositol de-N-acetylase [Anthonomus grandis grandis]|uniref:N-acetylglucosaminyl-phosphatidylinositol de-N-acetylase n=1 Tax=Anthonomus grandis grandis TaxID=2921223 RepID=UPI00216522B2|nr:N-acetylglucosaminyl-phosphatidylinositol de-N-acetylase [Anthonomus grandis grandis]